MAWKLGGNQNAWCWQLFLFSFHLSICPSIHPSIIQAIHLPIFHLYLLLSTNPGLQGIYNPCPESHAFGSMH